MKKKVFITGGGGMLASTIEAFYSRRDAQVIAPSHKELDVCDGLKIKDAILAFRPDYVFHTAALHVNDCEDSPDLAFKINEQASAHIASICSENDSQFIYISSCGYFGDEIRYYSESDPVALKTVYARSKYQGEMLSLESCKKTYAIRPGWLYGGSLNHKKNFVFARYKDAKNSPVIKSANDKHGCPTNVSDLVEKIDEILKTDVPGVYHVTNYSGCSRFEYIKKIVRAFNLKTEVIPVDSSNFPRKANVPNCELLTNQNIKKLGLSQLSSWDIAIEKYIRQLIKEM